MRTETAINTGEYLDLADVEEMNNTDARIMQSTLTKEPQFYLGDSMQRHAQRNIKERLNF